MSEASRPAKLGQWTFRRPDRVAALAAAINRSTATIRQYIKGERRFPANLADVCALETITNHEVTRYDVRPDTYGAAPGSAPDAGVMSPSADALNGNESEPD